MRWALSREVTNQPRMLAWRVSRQAPSPESFTGGRPCPQTGIAPGCPRRRSRMRMMAALPPVPCRVRTPAAARNSARVMTASAARITRPVVRHEVQMVRDVTGRDDGVQRVCPWRHAARLRSCKRPNIDCRTRRCLARCGQDRILLGPADSDRGKCEQCPVHHVVVTRMGPQGVSHVPASNSLLA